MTVSQNTHETESRIAMPKLTIADIHQRASHWLAEANLASEQGKPAREERCMKKAQYWLDRLNKAEGKG
jgi:hypothetical protein